VAAAGEQRQAFAGFFAAFGFWEDSGASRDNCVGGDNESIPLARAKLFSGQAQRMGMRRFVLMRGFVDVRGENFGGLNADLAEQGQTARAGGA
jgi:hypothetical protein